MGVDSDLVMVVKDRNFLPSKDQIFAILALYDKYRITEFGFPQDFNREAFLGELTNILPLHSALPVVRQLMLEVYPATTSIELWRWQEQEEDNTPPPTGMDATTPVYGKIKEICARFQLGYPAAHACVFLEIQNWDVPKMDLELGLPIRPELAGELRQELYYNPDFEILKKKGFYPDINLVASLSNNDVVLRILPEPLLSPMGDEPEGYDIELPDGDVKHVKPPDYLSHVLLLQQGFGRGELAASLQCFIAFFEKKYSQLLADLKRITGHEIFVSEFTY